MHETKIGNNTKVNSEKKFLKYDNKLKRMDRR